MKITLLLENNSLFGKYLNAEHGFSAWVEDEDVKVLYDFGFSDKFIHNAEALGIDLCTADYVILSHGHRDHSWGLKHLLRYYDERAMARKPIFIYSTEDLFCKKFNFIKSRAAGIDVDREILDRYFRVCPSSDPMWLTKNLCFMGAVEPSNDFERKVPQVQKKFKNGEWMPEIPCASTVASAAPLTPIRNTMINTRSSPILRTDANAKKITGAKHIHTYVGGSHLRIDEVPQSQVDKTCDYIRAQDLRQFYICHDTDLHCKLALWQVVEPLEVGTGLVVEVT